MRAVLALAIVGLSCNAAGLRVVQPAARESVGETNQGKAAPSAEQEVLKKWVGTWDATIESTGPDGKLVSSKATSSVRLAHGGKWLISEFDGTFNGAPFTGQEVLGYDPVAKKYVLSWIDSAATNFATGEGAFDKQSNTMTLTLSSRVDATGKLATWRQVDTWKDADNHVWTIRVTKDGKEEIEMTIRYKRKK
jgi:hypothetical protein